MPTARFARYLTFAPAVNLLLLGVLLVDHFGNDSAWFGVVVGVAAIHIVFHLVVGIVANLGDVAAAQRPSIRPPVIPLARPHVARSGAPPADFQTRGAGAPPRPSPAAAPGGAAPQAVEADGRIAAAPPRCAAHTPNGDRCTQGVAAGSLHCAVHAPAPDGLEAWEGQVVDAGASLRTVRGIPGQAANAAVPKARLKAHKAPSAKKPAKAPPGHGPEAHGKRPQCRALTASNKRCSNGARGTSAYCGIHHAHEPAASAVDLGSATGTVAARRGGAKPRKRKA